MEKSGNWFCYTICLVTMTVKGNSLFEIVIFSFVFINNGLFVHAKNAPPSPVSIRSVPFVASLQDSRHQCAASIVHERFLLTAASCLVDEFGRPLNITRALVGTNNLRKGGTFYTISSLIPHTKYSVHTGDYNVGLVKLASKVTFGPTVGPIVLGRGKVPKGEVVRVVGWRLGQKTFTGLLHKISMPVLNKEECQQGLLGRIIEPRMLCAGVGGKRGDCVSDEGGPVFVNGTLVAVASPFTGCGSLPGLYTRVSAVRGWITTTIDENCDIEI